ncbi:protocadherin gamma-A5-like [Hippocampus comes]|uniref:protocadherin gamma-A5-like n=1 Tax=Hippocampus comes TaxID=109280 RepID=UPI00094EC2AE|nr:PREDICTED: protocadherin gamma-A5-like [Hippocampus comes]
MAQQVLLFVMVLYFPSVVGQVSYSIPEEMEKGSLVSNVAQDLGLDLKRLKSGRARIHSGDNAEYLELDKERGLLLVKERIDRETLCGETTLCALHLQMILENPMELFRITIEITDINDNEPSFESISKRFEISELAIIGSKFVLEKAIDADIGTNGLQSYSLSPTNNFQLKLESQANGDKKVEMILQKALDREQQEKLSLLLTAFDGGQPRRSGTMQIISGKARIHTGDRADYVQLDKEKGVLVIKEKIDREAICGQTTPCALHFQIALEQPIEILPVTVEVTDMNDNDPVFEKEGRVLEISESAVVGSKFMLEKAVDPDIGSSYEAYVVENNTPGLSVLMLKASDADWNQNARLSYILEDSSVNGVPVSSYVSVSADSGVIHAVRSFDYEQLKEFNFRVRAQDGGSPPLSSNVSVRILIQDQNDNAPQVLYPVQTGGSLLAEMVPRSADVGYLVTKLVAVDVDSGQNAWLSYKVHKATDRALFEVGLHNGEIRTVRQVTDKDAVKQKMTVVVEDNLTWRWPTASLKCCQSSLT